MALFCDPEDLSGALGAHGFDSDELVAFCSRASARTQEGLKIYWPFPDYNATVPTPESVREAALEYALYLALKRQGQDNQLEDNSQTFARRQNFGAMIDDLNDTTRARITARVSGESLTFGLHNSTYVTGYDNAHVLGWQDIEIEENSAAIDGFHRAPEGYALTNPGGHFSIRYDEPSGLWLLWRFDSRIEDGMTVSYTINFLKWTKAAEAEAPPTGETGRLVLG